MAYTNAPENQTYKPLKIKFDGTPLYRYGNLSIQRDINIVNFFYDRISQENKIREVSLKKRPGLSTTGYSLSKSSSSDILRGHFYDPDQNAFYWAVNNKVYTVKPDALTPVRTVATLTTSSGYVGFCSFLKSTNVRYVVFSDGTELWYDDYAITTANKVTDVDLPSPHKPFPVYIDGYIFIAKSDSSDIYNSDLDDPSSWTSGDFISAEMGSDYIVRLAKTKNYLIAFGSSTIEYFWDAANASGSPLSRNEAPFRNIGYVTGFAQSGDKIYFVGQDDHQNISVFELDGFKINKISNEVVDRTIQTVTASDNVKTGLTLNKDGFILSVDGHSFYALTTSQTTWVYDIEEKFWYEWKNSSGTGLALEAAWSMQNGGQYVAIANQSVISQLAQANFSDFGSNFTCRYTTEDINVDTINTKFCSRVSILSDKYTNTGASYLTLYWSDDDWASSQGPRQINLFNDLACTRQLGRFRTRSFRLEYTDNYPLRITGMELDINVGNT